eukprot:GEMP01027239.1.p1 GENE.GEMP01027239.1~~GEMP01027239.1.p1  ORF type:complete len:465 (+),score=83.53 GEMP01027239.1:118-1512(+)
MGHVSSTPESYEILMEDAPVVLPEDERLDCFRNDAQYISRMPEKLLALAAFFNADDACALVTACHLWGKWVGKDSHGFWSTANCWRGLSGTPVEADGLIRVIKRFAIEAMNRGVPTTLGRIDSSLCRGILANAFFGNLKDLTAEKKHARNAGGLDFSVLFRSHTELAAQKILCLLHYFSILLKDEEVVFRVDQDTRSVLEFEEFLSTCEYPLRLPVITEESMEDSTCGTIVNFANSNFGYGRIIASCTQEEILQMCCPEFNVGLLYYGLIPADGVVTCRCRRFIEYTGYGSKFEFLRPLKDTYIQVVLTMDAVYENHFEKESVLRDIRKATIGFQNSPGPISTGKWGCGVFGGNMEHKFLQQVIAASIAAKDLRFSTFSNAQDRERLQLLGTLVASKCTVGALYQLLPNTAPADGDWYSLIKSGVSNDEPQRHEQHSEKHSEQHSEKHSKGHSENSEHPTRASS